MRITEPNRSSTPRPLFMRACLPRLFVGGGALLLCAVPLRAAAQSPAPLSTRVELRGHISAQCSLRIDPAARAGLLDIAGGERDLVVARITETCNAPGYTIVLSSRNAGVLRAAAADAPAVAYEVDYDGARGNLRAPLAVARSPVATRTAGLGISFPGAWRALPGVYGDVITLTVTAN